MCLSLLPDKDWRAATASCNDVSVIVHHFSHYRATAERPLPVKLSRRLNAITRVGADNGHC